MTPTSTRTELEESILTCCKSLFLTSAIPELIKQDGTPKQIEYLAVALQKEITRRDENKRARLVKRARFPIYKTFEGYEYRCVKLPPALCKEELFSTRGLALFSQYSYILFILRLQFSTGGSGTRYHLTV